ncbi:bifunctional DNA-formamidopyrimidine glycosylase/DNA-(apurinic or apyrimidinic site) lyase [Roseococcus pinisoli]|uniref:Formamidopyrimidine-DNA glycosylase n=1 Tax=Roseococcus pinisoli TaxID=2835040 RepID=A0ABS5Q6T7_9PROT|nr:bifunctional DNA-formamidopyrimidine glycosylase/DNA-(apurinic or apyrimidinic site) lyase [Roseococcus pinisoli]
MPELPEVETVMRGLAKVLDGEVIRHAEIRREGLRWPFPAGLVRALTGTRVDGFRRRGKYMLMRLADRPSVLLHLGMSGRMVARHRDAPFVPRLGPQGAASDARGHNQPPELHEHLVMETEGGWRVGFVDPRRFGAVDLVARDAEDSHRLLAGLGPEPLEEGFSVAVLERALVGRRMPIKAALLDQKVVAGLGNIYVCEVLFRAGISPLRLAGTLPGARAARLVPAIKTVLSEAIEAGGSSLRDYVRADGEIGGFQDRFDVYDREGERCRACSGPKGCPGILRLVQSGRSTFYCPRTQR